MYARRLSLPAAVSLLFLLILGSYATPARADVDIELIAETIGEEGYYVDSGAKFLKSDSALDRLRTEVEAARGRPVFVAVVPAGAAGSDLPEQLSRLVGRKGTYAVLIGDELETASTALPASKVNAVAKRAVAAHRGDPEAALVEFTRQLNRPNAGKARNRDRGQTGNGRRRTPKPVETVETELANQGKKEDKGLNLPLIGGVAALAVAAVGGYVLWRRRRRAAELASRAYQGTPVGAPAGGTPSPADADTRVAGDGPEAGYGQPPAPQFDPPGTPGTPGSEPPRAP